MSRLRGSTVLVTGAGRGIGRAIALRCAEEGAAVALAGRSVEQLEQVAAEVRETGARALVTPADVQDDTSISGAVRLVESELGPVDLLVANSGVAGPTSPLWDVEVAAWDQTQAVNVRGVFLSCRAVLPAMIRRRSGGIVVIGSMSGKRPLANRTAYTTSKSALIGLVRSLALDTGPYGVRVNLVSPGPVTGPRLDRVLEDQGHVSGRDPGHLRTEFAEQSPLKRLVEPDDVAAAVVFLASHDARSVTGEDVNVSAGITMY